MRHQQSGLAFIVLISIIVIGGLGWLLSDLNRNQWKIQNQQRTVDALAEAKDGLIGYLASHYERSGGIYLGLPCPDLGGIADEEGFSEDDSRKASPGACGADYQNSLGRFPWKTLGLAPLRDGDNECLWYAVSGAYKANPAGLLVNSDTAGGFAIYHENPDGSLPMRNILGKFSDDLDVPERTNRPIAVIIAPHKRMNTQDRSETTDTRICGGNYTASNYLEDSNNMLGTKPFIFGDYWNYLNNGGVESVIGSSPYKPNINDSIITVSAQDVFNAIEKRSDFDKNMRCLTQVVTECIAQYGRDNGRLIWPAPVNLDDYRQNSAYADDRAVVNLGRLPNELDDSNADLGITSPGTLISDVASSCNIVSLTASLSECSTAGNSTMNPNDADFIPKIRLLWRHWKDHFFYVVSEPFKPDAIVPASCSSNCITVDGNEFAGMVLLAGKTSAGQFRNMYPDLETVNDITNYVSSDNSDTASDSDGVGVYTLTPDARFAMCIKDDFPTVTVNQCDPP